jgi:hypothetical protein
MTDAAFAARRAYTGAMAAGVPPYIAFDVACAAYRAKHPAMAAFELRAAVARALALDLRQVAARPVQP